MFVWAVVTDGSWVHAQNDTTERSSPTRVPGTQWGHRRK